MQYLDKWLIGKLEIIGTLGLAEIEYKKESYVLDDSVYAQKCSLDSSNRISLYTYQPFEIDMGLIYAFYVGKKILCFGTFDTKDISHRFGEYQAVVNGDLYYVEELKPGVYIDIYSTESNKNYIELYKALASYRGKKFIKEVGLTKAEILDEELTQEILNEFEHWKSIQAIIDDNPSPSELDEMYDLECRPDYSDYNDTYYSDRDRCEGCDEEMWLDYNYCPNCGREL